MKKTDRFLSAAGRYLKYTLSLPERTVRSLAALAGGASTLLTKTVLPPSFRGTTIYNVSLGMMQRFIIEKVAGMDYENPGGGRAVGDDFIVRKMAGTALEAAGLMTIRFSPLWVFALAGDAAGGSKVYLQKLVVQLKRNGVIAEDAEAAELIDVLEAVQAASAASALSMDTPPLSRAQLSEFADEMKRSYARVFRASANLLPGLDELWQSLNRLAGAQNISFEKLCGILTVDAASLGRKSFGFISSTGRAGAELIDEKILESYRNTISDLSKIGPEGYMKSHMRPFMRSAGSHFNPRKRTWIESKLIGR